MYRLLERRTKPEYVKDYVALATETEYHDRNSAVEAAKALCLEIGRVIVVVQDIDEVQMAAVVTHSYVPTSPPLSAPVMRGGLQSQAAMEEEYVGPPREPKAKPRLLVLGPGETATADQMVNYLMVVVDGKVIKNAFGELEFAEMPLTPAETMELKRALGPR